jgi:hypothetical protein
LPLEGLFLRLEAAGFEITPADRLRVYRLLRAFGPDNLKNPEELGMILGPALCHNGGEQAKFARIYAAYLAELKETRPVLGSQLTGGEQTTEKKVRRWFDRAWPYIMLASFAIALAAFFLLRDEIRGDGATTVDITGPDFARIDEAITFKNRSYFAGKDSTTLKWVWTVTSGAAGDTILIDSTNWDLPYRVTPMIDEEARQLITLEVWAPGTNSNGRTIKYLDVKCSSPPPLIGIELPRNLADYSPDNEYRFTALFDDELLDSTSFSPEDFIYSWVVDDERQGRERVLEIRLPVEKRYVVGVTVSSVRAAAPCETSHFADVVTGIEKVTVPTYAFQPVEHERNAGIRTWVPWTIGGIWVVLFIWGFRRWLSQVRELEQAAREEAEMRKRAQDKVLAVAPDRPPYKIPWVSQAKNIPLEASHLRLARAMRERASEDGARELNVPATLKATINSGGFPNARFSAKSFASEYVLLIDEVDPKSHRGRLYRRLAAELTRRDVYAEVFYYQHQLNRCWNEREPEGIATEELAQRFAGQRLLILGDAHELLDHAAKGKPSLAPNHLRWISAFPQRLILTPVAPVDWGFQEKLLFQQFGLFPSDGEGILLAAEKLENNSLSTGGNFDQYRKKLREKRDEKSAKDFRWRDGKDVLEYFEHDPGLATWVRALAVYPNPNLDLTVAIGRRLAEKGVEVNYDNLLQISRWPALDEGYISSGVREDLLEGISPDVERLAREAVSEELRLARPSAAGGYAERQLDNILVVQRYLLNKQDSHLKKELHYLIEADVLDDALLDDLEREIDREFQQPPGGSPADSSAPGNEGLAALSKAITSCRRAINDGELLRGLNGLHQVLERYYQGYLDQSYHFLFRAASLRSAEAAKAISREEYEVYFKQIAAGAVDWMEEIEAEAPSTPMSTPPENGYLWDRIRYTLADGSLFQAVEGTQAMGESVENYPHEDIASLSERVLELEKQWRSGLIEHGGKVSTENRLAYALLELLREAEPFLGEPVTSYDPDLPSKAVEQFVEQKQYTQALGYLAGLIEQYAPELAEEHEILREQNLSLLRLQSPPPLKKSKARPTKRPAAPRLGEQNLANGLMMLAQKLDPFVTGSQEPSNIPTQSEYLEPPTLKEYFKPDQPQLNQAEEPEEEEELQIDRPKWFPMMIGFGFWIILFLLFGLYRWHNTQDLYSAVESYPVVNFIAEDKGPTSDYAKAHVQALTAYENGDYATFKAKMVEAQETYPEGRYILAEINQLTGIYNECAEFFNTEYLPGQDSLSNDDNFWELLLDWYNRQIDLSLDSTSGDLYAMQLNYVQLGGLMEYYAVRAEEGMNAARINLLDEFSGPVWDQYFDTLSYRPNLATLLDRESTRVIDITASELADGGLKVMASYYLRPSISQRRGLLRVSSNDGRYIKFPLEIDPDQTTATLDLEANDYNDTSDSLRVEIEEYQNGTWEEVTQKTIAFTHRWSPTRQIPPQQGPPTSTGNQSVRVKLVDQVNQSPIAGSGVVVYPIRQGEEAPTVRSRLASFLRNRQNPIPVVSLISTREGIIELDPPAEGISQYLVSPSGYEFQRIPASASGEVTLEFKSTTPDLVENPLSSQVGIQVVDENGQVLPGARLVIERGNSQTVENTDDITGLYYLEVYEGNEEDLLVTASMPGYRERTINLRDPQANTEQTQQNPSATAGTITIRLEQELTSNTFILRAGERRRLTQAASPLRVDRFIVEGDAVIELTEDVSDFVIEAASVDVAGTLQIIYAPPYYPGRGPGGGDGIGARVNCANGGSGQNGRPGSNGRNAPNVEIRFDNILRFEGMKVTLKGQNGSEGGTGGNGGRGGPGNCLQSCPAGTGGPGGRGGQGGNGGNGGNLIITAFNFLPKYGGPTSISELISFGAPPGLKGAGGEGGRGGEGGAGAERQVFPPCPADYQKPGQRGKNGSVGAPGYNGVPGQLINDTGQ